MHNIENITSIGCFKSESSTNVRVLMLVRKIHMLKSIIIYIHIYVHTLYISKKGLDGGIVERQSNSLCLERFPVYYEL